MTSFIDHESISRLHSEVMLRVFGTNYCKCIIKNHETYISKYVILLRVVFEKRACMYVI